MAMTGYQPKEIHGKNYGVFIGCSLSESNDFLSSDLEDTSGYAVSGCNLSMFPNRISYSLDLKGPSLCLDTACSSTGTALYLAVQNILNGSCDGAFVGGGSLLIRPFTSNQFKNLKMTSEDGKCKSFDADGKGYARSETVGILLIQKRRDARRNYGRIVGIKCNNDGGNKPSTMQAALLRQVYEQSGVDPAEVLYIETHGTGTQVGDPQEATALSLVYLQKKREQPLLLGAVKSNCGHAEGASGTRPNTSEGVPGVASIAKIITAMETGYIPGNLNFTKPNPNIKDLVEGRMRVVTDVEPLPGRYIAFNQFGFGGVNVHCLFERNTDPSVLSSHAPYPRLVLWFGRTEESLKNTLRTLVTPRKSPDFYGLVQKVASIPDFLMYQRGFAITDGREATEPVVQRLPDVEPQLWFVYSGMGSQWPGMARSMMRLPVFEQSIARSAKVLEAHGIDLYKLILEDITLKERSIIPAFVAIASIQVALTDLLFSLGLRPDGLLGHSVGELGCAYADGGLTAEQMVLAAYWRGRAIEDNMANLELGAMAAVGMSWDEVKSTAPAGIEPSCDNAEDSITISGPKALVQSYIKDLQNNEVFAREVNSCSYGFHSKYIQSSGPLLLNSMKKLITDPKPRSERWVSTSIPEERWGEPVAAKASAEYFVNNLLSPVRFRAGLARVPDNAVVVEIGPHCLLQALLRRGLQSHCTSLGLMKRDHPDNIQFFLESVGKMYNAGLNPTIEALYPPVHFPVPRGTEPLSPYMAWDHSQEWQVVKWENHPLSLSKGEVKFNISLEKEEYRHLSGHYIDGRVLVPATGYLTLVWRALAQLVNKPVQTLPVHFQNVSFNRATILPPTGATSLYVSITSGEGRFEVREGETAVVTGHVAEMDAGWTPESMPCLEESSLTLTSEDIYQELSIRGYLYRPPFQGLHAASVDEVPIYFDPYCNKLIAGGVQIDGLKCSLAPKRSSNINEPNIEEYKFVPYHRNLKNENLIDYIHVCSSLCRTLLEKSGKNKTEIEDMMNGFKESSKENIKKYLDTIENDQLYIKLLKELTEMPSTDTPLGHLVKNSMKEHKFNHTKDRIHNLLTTDHHMLRSTLEIAFENIFTNKVSICEISEESSISEDVINIIETFISMRKADYHVATLNSNFDKILHQRVKSSFEWDESTEREELKKADIFILNNTFSENLIENLKNIMKPNSFIIILHRTELTPVETLFTFLGNYQFLFTPLETIENALSKNFQVHSKTVLESLGVSMLVRKIGSTNAKENQVFIKISNGEYQKWVEPLKQKLLEFQEKPEGHNIWLFSTDENSGIVGLVNCLIKEPGGDRISMETRSVYNTKKEETKVNEPVKLKLDATISIVNMRFPKVLPLYCCTKLQICRVVDFGFFLLGIIHVSRAGFHIQKEYLSQNYPIGLEYSGIRVSDGARVMGIVSGNGLGTAVKILQPMVMNVPKDWSLQQAATVPVAYLTTYYAFFVRGKLRRGDSVLIHSATGALGQAAIHVALSMDCEIFVTVGVKYALNSLADDKLQATLRCLQDDGHFLEVGKYDIQKDSPMGMNVLARNTTIHGVLLDSLFLGREAHDLLAACKLVQDGLAKGVVKPIQHTVFPIEQVEEALRYMSTGKHIGKIVLKLYLGVAEKDNVGLQVRDEKAKTLRLLAHPKTHFHPKRTYIITGGLGGFGLELAHWMLTRGAQHIVLTSRSGVTTGFQRLRLAAWARSGFNVIVSRLDVSRRSDCEQLLTKVAQTPVGGIFNLAMVLRDAIMENQSGEKFDEVCRPKIEAARHLDAVSRERCPELEWFVCFSSVSCGRGNPGQSNYGMANSAMERLCETRRRDGLHGLSIQWGLIGDVGIAHRTMGSDKEVGGSLAQPIISCMKTLDTFMGRPEAVLSSVVPALKKDKSEKQDGATVSLKDTVAHILGIKDLSKVDFKASINDLGLDSLMGVEIKQTLSRNFELDLTIQEIRKMTFEKLGELEKTITVVQVNDNKETADIGLLDLNFLVKPNESILHLNEGKTGRSYFFIPPIEGRADVLADIARLLDRPVVGIQETPSIPLDSFDSYANYFLKHIKTLQPKGPYSIVGYSFGTIAATDVARRLAEAGETVDRLVLIDGSKKLLNTYAGLYKDRFGAEFEREAESEYLSLLLQDIAKELKSRTKKSLYSMMSYEERLRAIADALFEKSDRSIPVEALVTACHVQYRKMYLQDQFEPSSRYPGDVTLIKASRSVAQAAQLPEDYGLSEYCSGRITLHKLDATHHSIIQGENAKKVASIILNA
ncbi:FASN [Cordylochernes scorpioides]|uniref:Fatty acid synthase n=1 Tax=Cordylochernes scorpioides TaxID=51811 RepID=A0ABY6KSM3_9ARAC|nr:FASN [Cordylochernes scorpioides]